METTNLVASLIDTYKELNFKYRHLDEPDAAMEIVTRMRNDEIMFSKALKDRLTGIGTANVGPGTGKAEDIVDGAADNLAQMISQFGSARATTLNLLRGIKQDSVWQDRLDDDSTLLQRVEDLVRSDANQLRGLAETIGN